MKDNFRQRAELIAHDGNVNDVFEAECAQYVNASVFLVVMTNSLNRQDGAIAQNRQLRKPIFEQ